jgi:demethylmenaquinone methyltransferase/2-methoxy-6-polyprenyl-1,4-benzoquinol methylase
MPILDHFGVIAPYYDRLIRSRNADRMIELANLPVNGALLDAGGGTGRITAALTGMASLLVVADLSVDMLLQSRGKQSLRAVCSYTEKLPFSDRSFERVIMVDALHHVCSHDRAAAELWRVLNIGGRLVIEEPDIRKFSVKLVALAEKMALMRSHFLAPAEIVGLFPYANAKMHVIQDGFNVWVLIDKIES